MRKMLFLWAALLCSAALGADGVPVGQPFDLPFLVGGKPTTAKALVVETGQPAKLMHVFYADGGVLKTALYNLTRTDTPQPNPNPNPNPQPDPQPNPVVKPAAIYLVYESGDSSPGQAAVRADKAWKDYLTARGVRWMVFDDEDGENYFPQTVAQARKQGLPAVAIVYDTGPPTVVAAPTTPAAMKALCEKYGGKP